jgi:hypothetical protein
MPQSIKIDRSKSLQDLEGEDWGDPTTAETPMIRRVLALRRKPLKDLSNGEVRLAVGQKVSFPLILELAVERLSHDPLLEGDYYPGDVLAALVRLDEKDWAGRDDLRSRLAELFRRAINLSSEDADDFRANLELPSNGSRAN